MARSGTYWKFLDWEGEARQSRLVGALRGAERHRAERGWQSRYGYVRKERSGWAGEDRLGAQQYVVDRLGEAVEARFDEACRARRGKCGSRGSARCAE